MNMKTVYRVTLYIVYYTCVFEWLSVHDGPTVYQRVHDILSLCISISSSRSRYTYIENRVDVVVDIGYYDLAIGNKLWWITHKD